MMSIALTRFGGGPDRLETEPVGGEDQERTPDAGQDGARDGYGDQGPDHRAYQSPTAHPQGGPDEHIALAQVCEAADDRRGHDGDEGGALGERLRQPEANRHRGHEDRTATDANDSAQEPRQETARDQEHVAPTQGNNSSLIPTAPSTIATTIFSSRSGIRLSRRAPA